MVNINYQRVFADTWNIKHCSYQYHQYFFLGKISIQKSIVSQILLDIVTSSFFIVLHNWIFSLLVYLPRQLEKYSPGLDFKVNDIY